MKKWYLWLGLTLIFAIGGIIYEGLAIISSAIGILRFRKEKVSIKNKE